MSMHIKVLLFGPQAALVGADSLAVNVDTVSANVRSVMAALGDAAPELLPSLATSRLAINHAYASPEDHVSESDEVALIGMVSGG